MTENNYHILGVWPRANSMSLVNPQTRCASLRDDAVGCSFRAHSYEEGVVGAGDHRTQHQAR